MHRCQTCSRTDLPCISCNHYCPHTKLGSRGTLRIVDYRQTERQHRDDSGILATKLDLEVLAQADSSTHLHNAASLLAAASVGLAGASNFMLTPLDRA